MTKYERCPNCTRSIWRSSRTRTFLQMLFGIEPKGTYIHCPFSVDGIVTQESYEQLCNLGCGSFEDNAPKK
jgi:hypothetical protein